MSEFTKAEQNGAQPQQQSAFQGGAPYTRQVTPGGHPIDNTQPAFPVYHRKFGNPAPLGLLAFASTTFVLSLMNVGARGLGESNAPIIGLAVSFGGTAQFIAGVWEFASGNTFGATAFCGYGAFWWSFALSVLVPSAIPAASIAEGLEASYLGIYLSSWMIFTTICLLGALKSSVGLLSVFFFLDLTFILLLSAEFTGNAAVKTAGGAFGIVTAACAYYTGASGLLVPDASPFRLPVMELHNKD